MDKKARGLPESFELHVPESAVNGPVQLGDYLDEEESVVVPKLAGDHAPPRNVVEMPTKERRASLKEPGIKLPSEGKQRNLPYVPQPKRLSTSVLRKQVNMSPETLRMVDELLEFIRTYGVQQNTTASELFHAVLLALYEAREHLDLSKVPPRGRWGTPTAAAFPVALKNAMQAAIVEYYYMKQRG